LKRSERHPNGNIQRLTSILVEFCRYRYFSGDGRATSAPERQIAVEHICTGQNAHLMENMIADAANLGPPKGANA
jgi:hypothetical protein